MKIVNRRKKRMITPSVYFIAEVILAWLILSFVQLNFDINGWAIWSLIIFVGVFIYGLTKTIHVYKRQKNYPTE